MFSDPMVPAERSLFADKDVKNNLTTIFKASYRNESSLFANRKHDKGKTISFCFNKVLQIHK